MGAIAAELADIAIVTDDNPRSRGPRRHPRRDPGRRARPARDRRPPRGDPRRPPRMLREGDVLVVAGKGHEQGQIVGAIIHPSTTWPRPPRRWAWSWRMAEPLWTSDEIVAATGGGRRRRAVRRDRRLASTPARSSPATCSSPWPASARRPRVRARRALDRGAAGGLGQPGGHRRGGRGRRHAGGAGALELCAGRRAARARRRRAGARHRLGRQDQRHPGDPRRPVARRARRTRR